MSCTMTVYRTAGGKMELPSIETYEVGLHRDEKNRPLVVLDGKVLGTLHEIRDQMEQWVAEFERREGGSVTTPDARLRDLDLEDEVRRLIRGYGKSWR